MTEDWRKVYATGHGRSWSDSEREENKGLEKEYADLLLKEGILPSGTRASGFRLISPSAHQGYFEHALAAGVDKTLHKKPDIPPEFIAADFFGVQYGDNFVPGFQDVEYPDTLRYVTFRKLSIKDARDLEEIEDSSVNVVWDRKGALFHAQDDRLARAEVNPESVVSLLEEYKRVLKKPNGVVIIDDNPNPTGGARYSTVQVLEGIPYGSKYKIDLEELGWDVRHIGTGRTRLAVLKLKELDSTTSNPSWLRRMAKMWHRSSARK